MDVRSEFNQYVDSHGFISGEVNPSSSSGNAILFSAEALWVLYKNHVFTPYEKIPWLSGSFRFGYKKYCEVVPGLFKRPPPFSQDLEGPDDYIGLTSLSTLLGDSYVKDILAYGRSHFFGFWIFKFRYSFDPNSELISKDIRAWFGRFPALIAHFEIAAGERLNLFRKIAWAFSVAFSGSKSNQDPWILSWLMIQTYFMGSFRSWMMDVAIQIYILRFKKAHPEGMGPMLGTYFQNPDHPIAKYFIWDL